MDAVLTIESAEAVRLATELAELTGLSVEDAVARALRTSVQQERAVKQRAASILAAAAEIRSHMQAPLPTSDHSWLYGEDGLPA